MGDGFAIPATVQDVDLSTAGVALGSLMGRGEETPEEFAPLVRLLVETGQPVKAEYLLPRNVEAAAGELVLYRELFGTAKPDEFAAAVGAFAAVRRRAGVRQRPGLPRRPVPDAARSAPDAFALLGEPCEVRFDFADPEFVAADVCSESDERRLLLRWADALTAGRLCGRPAALPAMPLAGGGRA